MNEKSNRYTGRREWFYICFRCDAHLGRDGYNAELRALGIWPSKIKQGDFSELGPPMRVCGGGERPEPLMSGWAWEHAVLTLRRARIATGARRYLRARGIDHRQHDLGYTTRWGYPAIAARCYAGTSVVTEAYRFYGDAPRGQRGKSFANSLLRDRSVGWIGASPTGASVLLCAGFFDGFSARQHGLPAVSAVGATLPDHLVSDLAGRRVAVAYDVGEEPAAERTVAKLLKAECEAWVVRLGRLGLPEKGDLNDFFRAGGTPEHLLAVIKQEHLIARRRNRRRSSGVI